MAFASIPTAMPGSAPARVGDGYDGDAHLRARRRAHWPDLLPCPRPAPMSASAARSETGFVHMTASQSLLRGPMWRRRARIIVEARRRRSSSPRNCAPERGSVTAGRLVLEKGVSPSCLIDRSTRYGSRLPPGRRLVGTPHPLFLNPAEMPVDRELDPAQHLFVRTLRRGAPSSNSTCTWLSGSR